ncbi:MAG: thioredoxin [Candidatus Aminicenantes bacterium]|nr:thioredoxin [Candidatus Aminicenantes bacterium]
MSEDIISVSDANFEEEVVKSELPVLVDFWAVWCGPCHMIAPTVDYLAEHYKEKLKVVKMNVDENMKTPAKYGIMSIPALLLFKDGDVKETIVGALPQDKIVDKIAKSL